MRTILLAILGALALLLVIDRVRHLQRITPAPVAQARAVAAPPAAIAPTAVAAPGAAATVQPPPPDPGVRVGPTALVAPSSLELMARLAVRRRIVREGDRVYLDSIFPHTDSAVVHWIDHPVLTVSFVIDSSLSGWSPALLDEVRAAMRGWNGNASGLTFRERAADDSADITVKWVDLLSDGNEGGHTTLSWDASNVAQGAVITLAMRRTPKQLLASDARTRIALHEFGHALGLGHSESPDDVMFHLSTADTPSTRDQATLRLLYALPTGTLRVP